MLDFLRSFGYAVKGIRVGARQRNFVIQLFCALLTIAAGLFFDITAVEWCILVLCIVFVLSLELINSAIEHIVNMISPAYNETAGKIKDLAAGAVLIASAGSAAVALLIFRKYLLAAFFF